MPEAGSSQQLISIDTIRDDTIVLKDGGLRAVVEAEGINFELKSEEEQNGIINSFQEFLTSLDFSLQLMVYSRRINIDDYIKKIQALSATEKNELIKNNIFEYTNYLYSFLQEYNVMNKRFLIVVAYYPNLIKTSNLPGMPQQDQNIGINTSSEEEFQRSRSQLETRVNVITNSLLRTGIQTKVLNTEELVDLFYNLYNPMENEEKRYLS